MAVPALIPIAHEAGYRTDTIGRYDDGQFFA
jgi:formate hydrogenlyase regulatory protein HycA